jgi:hypothetical protein
MIETRRSTRTAPRAAFRSLSRAFATLATLALAPAALSQTPPAARPAVPPAAAPQTGPIIADPPGVDFGLIDPGTKVSATIKLLNPLDVPVTIKVAKPSCTCTTVDMVGKVIPAKGSIDMPMSLKTSHSVGKRGAVIDLVFEGINQAMTVKLEAETAYAVRANPPYIDALAPERMTGFFEVRSADGAAFEVLSVDGRPAVRADGKPMAPATQHVLRYDFKTPQKSVPPFLIVETTHPKTPLLDLRVRHETTRITPMISFAEFRANLGVIPAKGSTEYELEIKHLGNARIDQVTSLNPAAKTEVVSQNSDGSSVLVKFRFTDLSLPKGVFLFPCRFTSGQKSGDYWLYGVIR